MEKKGFTLVELLTTIIVLSIILTIAVPSIRGIVNNARKNTFAESAKILIKTMTNYKAYDEKFDYTKINRDKVKSILNVPNDNYKSVKAELENTQPYITIIGQNKWEGLIAYGTFNTLVVDDIGSYDTIAPVIQLIGDAIITLQLGETYVDEGATATDNIDGNITNLIVKTGNINFDELGVYRITYDVTDTAGNMATPVTRIINIVDASSPIITILGANPINIELGSPYTDEGATATDNIDGDLTNDIIITGMVNPNVVGQYSITYTVSDNAGNTVMTVREVNVVDTTSPVVSFEKNGNSAYVKTGGTKVTVTDLSNISILKYQWTNSLTPPTEDSFTTSFTSGASINTPEGLSGLYYLWVLTMDIYNNKPTVLPHSNIFYLDNTLPSIPAVNLNGYVSNTWTKNNVTQSFSSDDNHSGIQKYQYSTNGGSTWSDVANPYVINTNGQWTILVRAVDNAGNIGNPSSSYVVKRDTTPPSVPTVNLNGYASGSWTRYNVTQTLSSSDATSGLLKYQYSHDNANFADWPSNPWVISWDGQWNFYVRAVDNAGNVSASANAYTIRRDTVAPSIGIYGNNPVYIGRRSGYSDAGAYASDNVSGTGGISVSSTVNPDIAGTYYVYYNVSDGAGNPAPQVVRTVYVQESILTQMEAVFGKGAGGCVPGSVSGTAINADSYCYYSGGSANNYIYFNCDGYPTSGCQVWRIIGVKKDVNGTVGVRVLAPNGVIAAGSLAFHSSANGDWDSSTIRSTLNNGGQGWLKDSTENNGTYLVSMRYDKRQVNQDSTWAVSSVAYAATSNANYVGLPSALEFAQCNGNMNNSGGTGWGDSTCWANADSGNYWYWGVSEMYSSNYTTTKPGSYVSLNKGNCCNYRNMTNTSDTSTRPVLNLNPNLRVVGGNGTSGSPYQVTP